MVKRSWALASAPNHGRELSMSTGTSAPIWLSSVGRTGASAGYSALKSLSRMRSRVAGPIFHTGTRQRRQHQ
eukprot:5472107-Pyramimonas_sp.AAC.1